MVAACKSFPHANRRRQNMTTRIPSRHTILAAAILALLAGCGSGQDDSATRTKATANSLVTAASSSAQTTDGALAPSSKAAARVDDRPPARVRNRPVAMAAGTRHRLLLLY